MGSLRKYLTAYWADTSGQFAVVTAIVSIPLLIAVGYAIDHARIVKYESALSSAVDAAALAAVMPAQLSEIERKAYAEELFFQNFHDDIPVELDINATPEQVDIEAIGELPTLFGNVLGANFSRVRENASAVLTREEVVCALALDPSGNKAIEFADNARFNAPDCTVQTNSSHPNALWSKVTTPPRAKAFCSTGGSQGSFYPYVKTGCTPIEDPYKDLEVPKPGQKCDARDRISVVGNNGQGTPKWAAASRFGEDEVDEEFGDDESTGSEEIIPDNTTLNPGIFCKGIKIDGANVRLNPGVYHVWGNLEITEHAQVVGDRVTFILKGTKNKVKIEHGAQVYLRAPADGPTAGLVFWQIHLDFKKYVTGRKTPAPKGATAKSEIKSGGGMQIIGTAYFPNHELEISSDNSVASRAPATSFIAYRLKFSKEANLTVNVNHQAGGVPPLEPRSDDGARLVR